MQSITWFAAGLLLMSWGFFQLVARLLPWRRFRHSGLTIVFMHQEDWDHPISKVLDILDPLVVYSFGFWIMMARAF